MPKGSRNASFLVNSTTDQASWKRLLRGGSEKEQQARKVLKQLLDLIDITNELSTQLDGLIRDATDLYPWIAALVQTPEAIRYCQSRCLRSDPSGQIYLLSKTQMNGMHAELFTYSLYCALRADITKYSHLTLMHYVEVSEADSEPRFYISFIKNEVKLQFSVGFNQGCYEVNYAGLGLNVHESAADVLRDLGFMEGDNMLTWTFDRDDLESWLLDPTKPLVSEEA